MIKSIQITSSIIIAIFFISCGQEKQFENKQLENAETTSIETSDSTSINSKQDTLKHNPWDIGCDTMDTQGDMNICSYESFLIADSILSLKYSKLLHHLDSSYSAEKGRLTGNPDKISLEILNIIKNQKASLVETQRNFVKYRKSLTNIISLQYQGGTMRPLVENTYALELTVNQINIITEMTEEIIN